MSPEFEKKILAGLFSALSALSASGCYSAVPADDPSQVMQAADVVQQRLIIKLKQGESRCDADGISKLSSAARVSVEFLRSMSGGLCVIVLHADSPASLLQGQGMLRQYPEIEWLEEDRKMKALTPQ